MLNNLFTVENHISPEDLREFIKWCRRNESIETTTTTIGSEEDVNYASVDVSFSSDS